VEDATSSDVLGCSGQCSIWRQGRDDPISSKVGPQDCVMARLARDPLAPADAQNGRPEPAALSSVMAWGIALSSATLSLSWTAPSPSRKYLS
jgi:hypothetical protein